MDELTKSLGDLALSWAAYEGQLDWTTASDYTWDFDTDEYYAVWTAMDRVKALYAAAQANDEADDAFRDYVGHVIADFTAFNEVGIRDEERENRARRLATLLDVPFRGFHSA
jgi:hypothetical protein